MPEHFLKPEEAADLRTVLKKAKKSGAVSGGVFGSILKPKARKDTSDIDVFINDSQAPIFGEIESEQGEKSGTWLHVFKKRPGLTGGKSRREKILDTAETEGKKLFGK